MYTTLKRDHGEFNSEYMAIYHEELPIDAIELIRMVCPDCRNSTTYGVDYWDEYVKLFKCNCCERWYAVCFECNRVHGEQDQTVQLMSLQAHHNTNGVWAPTIHRRIIKNGIFNRPSQVEETDATEAYCIEDKDCRDSYYGPFETKTYVRYVDPTFAFDEKVFGMLTGPDGGFQSIWRCGECNMLMTFNDK